MTFPVPCSGGRRRLARLAGLLVVAAAPAAMAQNVSNEAWLGQLGNQNSLDITQEGRGNSAGANNEWLLLGQEGVGNGLILVQYGYDNKLGTLFGDEEHYARGVWQRGDLNTMTIRQRNSAEGATNILGAVQQWSAINLPAGSEAFNRLDVTQTDEGDASGVGAHYVGRIVQWNNGADGTTNTVIIVQRGGGAGAGNVLANLRQIGSGNSLESLQTGTGHRIGEVPPPDGSLPVGGIVQQGVANSGWLEQNGAGHLIEYVQQYGDRNEARVTMTGDRNVISRIFQNSESWDAAAAGNRIAIAISGADNGGTGDGWIGELIQLPALATPGIAQANFTQIGDDNDISLAVLSGIESKYGVTQVGDGNDVHVSISGAAIGADAFRNETAVFQEGDLNYVRHEVTGSDNAGAIRMEGDRNRLSLGQRGQFNTARVSIDGDDNNGQGSALFGVALDLVNAITDELLAPGAIVQAGAGLTPAESNDISFDVAGTANALAFYQNGHSNRLQGLTSGSGNALVVVQTGQGNMALASQAGAGNAMAVHQF